MDGSAPHRPTIDTSPSPSHRSRSNHCSYCNRHYTTTSNCCSAHSYRYARHSSSSRCTWCNAVVRLQGNPCTHRYPFRLPASVSVHDRHATDELVPPLAAVAQHAGVQSLHLALVWLQPLSQLESPPYEQGLRPRRQTAVPKNQDLLTWRFPLLSYRSPKSDWVEYYRFSSLSIS